MSRLPSLAGHISFRDGPQTDWKLVSLRGEEQLNRLYEFTVGLETEELEGELGELLGATCEVTLQRGESPARSIFGVVARVDYLGFDEHHLHARVTLVSAFGLARQRQNSRIWQARSAQEIITEVLAASLEPYGRSVELGHLQRGNEPRDYCVQYRENDHEFVCRLLEEEGISWFFAHDAERGHEVLTLCDDNEDYPKHRNIDGSNTLPLIAHNPDEADLESLQRFDWSRELKPTTYALSEYDSGSPGAVAAEQAGEADERGRVRRIYDHGHRRLAGRGIAERVQDLTQAQRVLGSRARCQSNASLAGIGQRFMLEGVGLEGVPSEWIVTGMHHEFSPQGSDSRYQNTFSCVPASTELRPAELTLRPRVEGPQTATVVGGGEIDVDSQGRIQVQMHWQEDPSFGGGASCRVRCAQSWAGAGWGAQFIPRVGMEVVVEFLDGNPDRPLVTGCVYNGGAEPPFGLPGKSTQSGWRSNSSPGGGGSNEFRFEDAAGAEEIYLHGQRDWNTQIKRNKAQAIGQDESLDVGNNRHKSVGADEIGEIGANQKLHVKHDQVQLIDANQASKVGANQSLAVGGSRSLSVGSNHSETIGASASETVAVAKTVTVGGMLATVVGGAMNTSVGAACLEEIGGVKIVSVGASSSLSVGGPHSVDAATISHQASAAISQSAGTNISLSASENVQISAGAELGIRGKTKGLIELEDELILKVGKASITLKKNGELIVEGTKISIKGKKSIVLKSKKVDQN